MKIIYSLIGLFFFCIEILIYEWSHRLSKMWYATKMGIGMQATKLCKNPDAVGNCLDFHWSIPVGLGGAFGIKVILLFLFFIILLKTKKISHALLMVSSYSILILNFHLDWIYINIKQLRSLSEWLDVLHVWGILSVGVVILISLLTSIIYYFYRKKLKIITPSSIAKI